MKKRKNVNHRNNRNPGYRPGASSHPGKAGEVTAKDGGLSVKRWHQVGILVIGAVPVMALTRLLTHLEVGTTWLRFGLALALSCLSSGRWPSGTPAGSPGSGRRWPGTRPRRGRRVGVERSGPGLAAVVIEGYQGYGHGNTILFPSRSMAPC